MTGFSGRWDTDWFWCSKNLGAQNPLMRRILGRSRLNSRTYTRVMRWNSRWKITHRFDKLSGLHRESVIQDVDIPLERAPEFLEFFRREIGILPVWICPIRAAIPQGGSTCIRWSRQGLCKLRILDSSKHGSLTERTFQPAHRTQSCRTRRNQVTLFGKLLSARRVLGNLR